MVRACGERERLRWLGHVERERETEMVRACGERERLRWLGHVERERD